MPGKITVPWARTGPAGERGELQQGEIAEHGVGLAGQLGQRLGDGAVLVEELVVRGERHGDTEPLEQLARRRSRTSSCST